MQKPPPKEASEVDRRFMRRAILLSQRGFPAPNPHVGCVLAHEDRVVGEGYHHYAGGDHAEVAALKMAGSEAAGATAYVTLEPCNHFGRTPPCSLALIEAKVARVVIASADPNPRAVGGIAKLEEEGIRVEVGLLEVEAARANEQFLSSMRERRPYIVVKAAISLDGRIALPSGESQWITSQAARTRSHRLRAECGAVLVGRKTVEQDNPRLTARIRGVVNQPVRVVLDPSRRLTEDYRVFDGSAPTLHLADGTEGLRAGMNGFDLVELTGMLFKKGITGLLVEGGGATIASFLKSGLVDRVELFVAPKILGAGRSWVEGILVDHLAEIRAYRVRSVKKLSGDLQITLSP